MPAPKRLRIVNAIANRAASIGHLVFRDLREPQSTELPCIMVFAGERTVVESKNRRARCAMQVTVAGYRRLDDSDSEIVGNEILADITAAIELTDDTLGGLVVNQSGLEVVSEQIYLPDIGDNVVAAEIVYSVPHIRIDGDPEIS